MIINIHDVLKLNGKIIIRDGGMGRRVIKVIKKFKNELYRIDLAPGGYFPPDPTLFKTYNFNNSTKNYTESYYY
jgi:hypothetical protein